MYAALFCVLSLSLLDCVHPILYVLLPMTCCEAETLLEVRIHHALFDQMREAAADEHDRLIAQYSGTIASFPGS